MLQFFNAGRGGIARQLARATQQANADRQAVPGRPISYCYNNLMREEILAYTSIDAIGLGRTNRVWMRLMAKLAAESSSIWRGLNTPLECIHVLCFG
jgi:hypothetical protein